MLKYQLLEEIGKGCFGSIYKGQNIVTKEWVAIKRERIDSELMLLKREAKAYRHLHGCKGIPVLKWFGKDATHYYMVITLLGPSLQAWKLKNPDVCSLPLVHKLGIQMIQLLQTIHDKGLIHRDIKPDNFLFSCKQDLYLIDFGFCKSYLQGDGTHIPMKQTCSIVGSVNYASISAHRRIHAGRRDDVESVGYVLMYLMMPALPWEHDVDEKDIVRKKETAATPFLSYARSLGFEERPDYEYLKRLLS